MRSLLTDLAESLSLIGSINRSMVVAQLVRLAVRRASTTTLQVVALEMVRNEQLRILLLNLLEPIFAAAYGTGCSADCETCIVDEDDLDEDRTIN